MEFDPLTKLNKLLLNQLDTFEVLSECQKFRLELSDSMDFSCQKYLLQKFLLMEILKNKNIVERSYYENLLESTVKFLKWKAEKVKGIPCSFAGCLFLGKHHRQYLQHLREIHPSQTTYCCNKRKCKRNFSSIDDILNHVKKDHNSEPSNVNLGAEPQSISSEACKCCMISCGQKPFSNIKELASHMNIKHSEEPRFCIFENCNQFFNPGSTSRHHFRIKHFQRRMQLVLKEENRIRNVTSIVIDDDTNPSEMEEIHQTAAVIDESYEDEWEDLDDQSDGGDSSTKNDEIFFMMAYCDFLNRLTSFKFIPLTSVRSIATEYIAIAKKSALQKETVLRSSLLKCSNLTPEEREHIVSEVTENDLFLKAQESLLSDHKRSKFISENFNVVNPLEIILNPDEVKMGLPKDCIHYIPIRESLKVLLEDKTFNKAFEEHRNVDKKSGLEDIKDGLAFKENEFFKENPNAFTLQVYSDALEVCNPLASGRLKHKIVQVFWSLCDIDRRHRSQTDKLQLGLVFKEKLLKRYSLDQIFKHLLDDLLILEDTGLALEKPVERTVKAGLIAYVADNLEVRVFKFCTYFKKNKVSVSVGEGAGCS